MDYYPNTTDAVRAFIRGRYRLIKKVEIGIDMSTIRPEDVAGHNGLSGQVGSLVHYRLCQHILHLLDEIEQMGRLPATRHIKQVLNYMETMRLMTREDSEELMGIDVEALMY